MQLRSAVLVAALMFLSEACSADARPEPLRQAGRTATYRHGSDVIEISLGRQTVKLLDREHPLQDCSNAEFHCYKSEGIGFHFAFPKKCHRRFRRDSGSLGGYRFHMMRGYPHLGVNDGGYVSDMGYRFLFAYIADQGLIEISYDKAGEISFGPGQNGGSVTSIEAGRYRYMLVGKKPFLACKG